MNAQLQLLCVMIFFFILGLICLILGNHRGSENREALNNACTISWILGIATGCLWLLTLAG